MNEDKTRLKQNRYRIKDETERNRQNKQNKTKHDKTKVRQNRT